jgi:hypothetical protein
VVVGMNASEGDTHMITPNRLNIGFALRNRTARLMLMAAIPDRLFY